MRRFVSLAHVLSLFYRVDYWCICFVLLDVLDCDLLSTYSRLMSFMYCLLWEITCVFEILQVCYLYLTALCVASVGIVLFDDQYISLS